MRQVEIVLCVVAFGIVGHGGPTFHSYWNWCMFTWFFCALMTLVIVIIEMLGLHLLLRLCMNWDDFTTGMAMLSSLMVFSASIIYPVFYACKSCILAIVATAVSFLCFVVYTVLAKHSGGGGYLSTVPGFLKVLEAFVACIIFISLTGYFGKLGMEWCVVVYAVCFPITVVIIVLNVLPILKLLPFPFDKVMAGFHVLAVLLYLSAAILWPYYSL
nr:PREDICTED: myeloid-associated differentiation marker-like [Lepisosteus oculatus]